MREIHPFEPFIPEKCSYLMLGSFPGRHSTGRNAHADDWYYSAGRNQFWKIMGELWPCRDLSSVELRMKLFSDLHMAVADVILSCERRGESNLDSSLRKRVYNTEAVGSIMSSHVLSAVFCTGRGVAAIFSKYFPNSGDVPVVPLPSPSPAMFRMTLTEKTNLWRELFLEYGVVLPV